MKSLITSYWKYWRLGDVKKCSIKIKTLISPWMRDKLLISFWDCFEPSIRNASRFPQPYKLILQNISCFFHRFDFSCMICLVHETQLEFSQKKGTVESMHYAFSSEWYWPTELDSFINYQLFKLKECLTALEGFHKLRW